MQHRHEYKGYFILYCLRSDAWHWHIFIEVPGGEAIHVGPDDFESLQEAELYIDAQEAAGLDRLTADIEQLFGQPTTASSLAGTWPGEPDDGFEALIDKHRHGETK